MWRCEALLVALLASCAPSASSGVIPRGPATELVAALPGLLPVKRPAAVRGAAVYERNCVSCHGVRGDGRGESAPMMNPRPRDLVAAVFKCRSTPSGALPLPSDLRSTVRAGVHATAMPGWAVLGEAQVADVVEYVRSFSPRWAESVQRPVDIPPETPNTAAARTRGRAVYERLGCAACHGPRGQGDGPSVNTLRDDSGNSIVPFDFSGATPLRCGSSPRDLYRTFLTGIDGTPMPSFAGAMTPEEGWDLVHFLASLRR